MSADTSPFEDVDLALASLSGEADAAWARRASDHADMAFLGGISLDEASRAAARELVERDRTEFLPEDPLAFVDEQLSALGNAPIRAAVNVRSATVDPVREAAEIADDHGAVLEVNAHCRQPELCAVGCGESLLADTDRLVEYVAAAVETGATVCVKVRTEVEGVDLVKTGEAIEAAGAEAIHIDAMDTEAVVGDVAAATGLFVIANNEVRGRESIREYLGYGADAVSVGRPSRDPSKIERIRRALDAVHGDRTVDGRAGHRARDGGESA